MGPTEQNDTKLYYIRSSYFVPLSSSSFPSAAVPFQFPLLDFPEWKINANRGLLSIFYCLIFNNIYISNPNNFLASQVGALQTFSWFPKLLLSRSVLRFCDLPPTLYKQTPKTLLVFCPKKLLQESWIFQSKQLSLISSLQIYCKYSFTSISASQRLCFYCFRFLVP